MVVRSNDARVLPSSQASLVRGKPKPGKHRMIRNRRYRRALALLLIVVGALVMLLSTSVGAGLLVFGLGVLLELIGLALERRDPG